MPGLNNVYYYIVQEKAKMKTVVVGVGNEIREDDGIGLVVVAELDQDGFNQKADLLVLGDQLFGLPELAVRYRRMVIVDALPPVGNPGQVTVIPWGKRSYIAGERFSLHDLDLIWQIQTAQAKHACNIWVIGIEAGALGWRLGLSAILQKQLREIMAEVKRVITELL
jgi:hydrogenase maturation protease